MQERNRRTKEVKEHQPRRTNQQKGVGDRVAVVRAVTAVAAAKKMRAVVSLKAGEDKMTERKKAGMRS